MQYDKLSSKDSVEKTIVALGERGIGAVLVDSSASALAKIKEMIPHGLSVMNGSSRTLEQIGFVEYLKSGAHGWNNLHARVLAETDPVKQARLRKESVLSDYYLGSAHAVAETGEIVIASNSGSQLPHLVYTSPNIILVVGTHKITRDLATAIARVREHALPLEDARAKSLGWGGSQISKLLIIERENPKMGRNFKVLFVPEILGF